MQYQPEQFLPVSTKLFYLYDNCLLKTVRQLSLQGQSRVPPG